MSDTQGGVLVKALEGTEGLICESRNPRLGVRGESITVGVAEHFTMVMERKL
jgi:hypothetical protein